jgi:CRISPR-associated exonuclease Cas4
MDDIYAPLSALNQLSYCPRRCFLIHHDGVFEENVFTLEGRLLHERADTPTVTVRNGVREHRHVQLISHRLRLRGVADVIEEENGIFRAVEYKRGRRGKWENDDAQVCAQALCLEEMLGLPPQPEGAIFYAQSGRRRIVPLTEDLRRETVALAAELHALLDGGRDPGPVFTPRCDGCSLYAVCLPKETPKLKAVISERLFSGE